MARVPAPRIELARGSQVVASRLRAMILHGELAGIERLPPEPEFAEQLGISRHHLREALRLLEQDGLVQIKRGHTGGIFLTTPDAGVLGRTLEGILARTGTELDDFLEATELLEQAAARQAARRATPADIEALRAIVARQEEEQAAGRYDPRLNGDFHETITRATNNRTLTLLMSSMNGLWLKVATLIATQANAITASVVSSHRAILTAIEAGDATGAERAMRDHMENDGDRARGAVLDRVHTIGDAMAMLDNPRLGSANGQSPVPSPAARR